MKEPQSPDWNLIRAFLATAEEGSLSAAARRLGLTQPTLSRQVAALEEELGVLLFERLGRTLALTDAGRELLAHSQRMGQAADGFLRAATGQAQTVEGLVRITASDIYSVYVLPRVLRLLRERAPRLTVEVVAANDIRDLMRREADIAIRHVRPDQPDLIARKLPDARAHLYAAQSYLERKGSPQTPKDCATHDFLGFTDTKEMIQFLTAFGITTTEENFPLLTQNGLVAWEYVRLGFGIAIMASDAGDHTPGVQRLLPDMPPVAFPVWLTTHRELHTSKKIRLVFDTLAETLGAQN